MTANRPFDDDDLSGRYNERRTDPNRDDREISLSTPTILGIFFALALVCACFFGFGYAMGHKSAPAVIATIDPASGVVVGGPKPTAGSASARSSSSAQTIPAASGAPVQTSPIQTATVSLSPPAPPKNVVTPADRIIVGDKLPTTAPQTSPNLQSATSFVVQVAAVSSPDVADILTNSLQKKGYTVTIHHEAQDKLLHVQIGPFPDRKQADAMRARVLADGFNAIVK